MSLPSALLCQVLRALASNSHFDEIVIKGLGPNGRTWISIPFVSHWFQQVYLDANMTDILFARCMELYAQKCDHIASMRTNVRNSRPYTDFFYFRNNVGYDLVRNTQRFEGGPREWRELGFVPSDRIDECLRVVLNSGSTLRVKRFCNALREEYKTWQPKNDLLFKPAKHGRVDQMQLLVDAGFSSFQKGGEHALRKAVRYGHVEAIKYLLQNGAMPTKKTLKHLRNLHNNDQLRLIDEYVTITPIGTIQEHLSNIYPKNEPAIRKWIHTQLEKTDVAELLSCYFANDILFWILDKCEKAEEAQEATARVQCGKRKRR